MKKVGVLMGSDSDLPVVRKALDTLRAFGVPYEVHVYSAHRTPAQAQAFCSSARDQGFGVLICAAGMAAHLAGAAAANTTLPVIGIPMASGGLGGDGRPAVHGPDALRDSGGYGSRQWRSQRRHFGGPDSGRGRAHPCGQAGSPAGLGPGKGPGKEPGRGKRI